MTLTHTHTNRERETLILRVDVNDSTLAIFYDLFNLFHE